MDFHKPGNITFLYFCCFCFCVILSISGCDINTKWGTVTLHYAAWNLDKAEKYGLERQMIEAYMKLHQNIKIVVEEKYLLNSYNETMKLAAESDSLPDVFMYAEIPAVSSNNWCSDITDVIAKDDDWEGIPEPFRDAVSVKGKTVAVPYGMYIYGYFYNKDLFDLENVKLPQSGFSTKDFKNAILQTTDVESGYVGLADEGDIINWFPAAVNKKLGWFSWDGGKFHINSQEFIEGVNLARDVYKKKLVFSSLNTEERKRLKAENDWEAWCNGKVAMKFDGTWAVQDYSKLPFKVGFAGIPGGRACIVPDFAFVSNSCKNIKEAYEFAKFMSPYSPKGFKTRMELAKAGNLQISTLPMIKDEKLLRTYFNRIAIDGVYEVYRTINETGYVESYKTLPGYSQARWSYVTGIKVGNKDNATVGEVFTDIVRGSSRIEDLSDELNSIANECIQVFPRQYIN